MVTWGLETTSAPVCFPIAWLLAWQCEKTGPKAKYGRHGSYRQERNLQRERCEEGDSRRSG